MIIMINFYSFETNIGFLFVCLFVCLFVVLYVPLEDVLLIWRRHRWCYQAYVSLSRQRSLPHRSCCDTWPPFLLPHLDFGRIPYHQTLNLTIWISYTCWYFPTIRTILVDFYTILSHQNSISNGYFIYGQYKIYRVKLSQNEMVHCQIKIINSLNEDTTSASSNQEQYLSQSEYIRMNISRTQANELMQN